MKSNLWLWAVLGGLLFALLPTWPYSNQWGYTPSVVIAVIFLALWIRLITRRGNVV